MDRLIVLDAGPTGLASKPPGRPDAAACLGWIDRMIEGEWVVALPQIARYEVRRELVRVGATAGLRRLDELQASLLFLPLTAEAFDLACNLWAHVRRAGIPTAPDEALDGDAILAAQALVAAQEFGPVVVATTNAAHLARFPGIEARDWRAII